MNSYSQTGNYFIQNYYANVYNAAPQNLDIAQDDFGLIYVANNSCILQYNGKAWELIRVTSDYKTPLSLLKASDGTIYVGSENELGYLEKNDRGKMVYHSLMSLLTEEQKQFSKVWNIFELKGEVFFCANEEILAYKAGKFRAWKGNFHKPQIVNGYLLVREVDKGLFWLDDNGFRKIKGSEVFAPADSKIAFYLAEKEKGSFLVVTRAKGVFRLKFSSNVSESEISAAKEEVFRQFQLFEPYDAVQLPNKEIVVGSIDKGLFVFNRDFKLLQTININDGAIDDECRRLFLDRQQNLWVAYNNGISKVEIGFPLKKWDIFNGLKGSVARLEKFRGKLYAATSKGLVEFDDQSRKFLPVAGLSTGCSDLLITDGQLYVGTHNALYRYDGVSVSEVLALPVFRMIKSPSHPYRIFIGTSDGITIFNSERQTPEKEFASGLSSEVTTLGFANEEKLVASTRSSGMFVADLSSGQVSAVKAEGRFSASYENYLLNDNARLFVASDSGLFKIDDRLNFEPLRDLNKVLAPYELVNFEFSGDEIYIHANARGEVRNQVLCYSLSGKPVKRNEALDRLENYVIRDYYSDSSRIMFASTDGVFILDKTRQLDNPPLKAFISRVVKDQDTILFSVMASTVIGNFSYGENRFMFQFGANDFSDEAKLTFQYYLEGSESDYNIWTLSDKARYENKKLKEGNYRFHLRARNIFGEVSDDLVLEFRILPPWYRTGIAYALYVVLAAGLIFFIIRLNAKRLIEQNRRLEKTIEERTLTIRQQKTEIEHKNQEITDSINYAQKIQLALMASLKVLDKNLRSSAGARTVSPKDYFLLYQPKDIVSGDFYWATELQVEGKRYFLTVIADCTGHGVPGAFMSLLCIGFLNEITKEKKIAEPASIFNELRLRIISTLNPDGSEGERKDGMDAVLLAFCEENGMMHFAAANNSFYVIRNNELLVMKADKMPVGKHSEENLQSFSSNAFKLEDGDVLYVFTDGLADQFGGPKGKKFKYKQLEALFMKLHNSDCAFQKEQLASAFNDWKGEMEQVDDVLILGVKF